MTRKKKQHQQQHNNENKYEEYQMNKGYGEKENRNDWNNGNIVLRVYLHCEECEEKVRKSLRGIKGVETLEIDVPKYRRVTVKGGKYVDPVEVADTLWMETKKKVKLISPKAENESPTVNEVVLKVYMHFDSDQNLGYFNNYCAKELKEGIHKLEGVHTVNLDTGKNLVKVKGSVEPEELAEYISKKLGRHPEIVKQNGKSGENEDGNEGNQEGQKNNLYQYELQLKEHRITNGKGKETKNDVNRSIILGVYMQCERCEETVQQPLRGLHGVETVDIDDVKHMVTIKGQIVDPVKVAARLRKKTGKGVELISPRVRKPQPPNVTEVVLKVHMHCNYCAKELKKGIHKLEGVHTVNPDTGKNLVTVKGSMDPKKLADYIIKKLGRHAEIVKQTGISGENEDGNNEGNQIGQKNNYYQYDPQLYIHCEGYEEKVPKSLHGFEGVETVEIDIAKNRETMKRKNANPVKVAARTRKKTGKSVELISPKVKNEEKKEDKKPQPLEVTEDVLKVYMHCDCCAKELKKGIHKLKGVHTVNPYTGKNQVTVKESMDPEKLVQYVSKKLRRHTKMVKQNAEAGASERSHGWQVDMEIESGYVKKCFGSRRHGLHHRGRRLVAGSEEDDGIFVLFQNSDTSELSLMESGSDGPGSNPPVLPLNPLGLLVDSALIKHNMEVIIKNAIGFATSRTRDCSGKDQKVVARYLADNNVVFEIEVDHKNFVTNGHLGLSGDIIYLNVGDELLIAEGFSTKLEIRENKSSPTLFHLKSLTGESYICCSEGSGCSRTRIILAVKAFMSKAFLSIPLRKVFWRKPPSGCLKLNTAGIRVTRPDGMGMGNLIRDENGEWLIGSWGRLEGNEDQFDRIEIRLRALKEGLSLAYNYNPNVTYLIESCDSLMVKLVLGEETPGIKEEDLFCYKDLLSQCREGMKALAFCKLESVYVEANNSAVWLASEADITNAMEISDRPPARNRTLISCLARERAKAPTSD